MKTIKFTAGMEISEPCIVDGMPNDYYHSEPTKDISISTSGLKTILNDCPLIYWYNSNLNPNKPVKEANKNFEIGSAAHDYILQKENFMEFNFVMPEDITDFRTKKAQELRDAVRAEGKNVISFADFQMVKAMAQAINEHPFAGEAFTEGKAEQSLFWQDAETGIWCRCRPDYLPTDLTNVPDYKTSVSANPREFQKSFYNYGYHQQAAWYQDGIEICTGIRPENFFFVVQEKKAPYIVSVLLPDPEAVEYGRKQNKKALRLFADCLEKNNWPGYVEDVEIINIPEWAKNQIEQDTFLTEA